MCQRLRLSVILGEEETVKESSVVGVGNNVGVSGDTRMGEEIDYSRRTSAPWFSVNLGGPYSWILFAFERCAKDSVWGGRYWVALMNMPFLVRCKFGWT